jgi:hypothetical protein
MSSRRNRIRAPAGLPLPNADRGSVAEPAAAMAPSATPAISTALSTAKRNDCGNVVRPFLAKSEDSLRESSCGTRRRSLDSRVRRPRSAVRSKPVSRTVRGRRKAKPESYRGRWTKAPPGRRTSGPGQAPSTSAPPVARCTICSRIRRNGKRRKVRLFPSQTLARPCRVL